MTNVLITGAAGNLGSLLSKYIKNNESDLRLILMQHQKEVPRDLRDDPEINISDPTAGTLTGDYDADVNILTAQLVWNI